MLAYSSIGQIGYVIIGIIVGDSNDGYASMITGAPVYGGPAKGGEGPFPGVTNYFSRSKNGKGEEGTVVPICLPKDAMEKFQLEVQGLTTEIVRSEEHTSELQSLRRISYAVFCLPRSLRLSCGSELTRQGISQIGRASCRERVCQYV